MLERSKQASSHHPLADLLAAAEMSPDDLAATCQLSLGTIQRALAGVQITARNRALIVAALNERRAELGLSELRASQVFPLG